MQLPVPEDARRPAGQAGPGVGRRPAAAVAAQRLHGEMIEKSAPRAKTVILLGSWTWPMLRPVAGAFGDRDDPEDLARPDGSIQRACISTGLTATIDVQDHNRIIIFVLFPAPKSLHQSPTEPPPTPLCTYLQNHQDDRQRYSDNFTTSSFNVHH